VKESRYGRGRVLQESMRGEKKWRGRPKGEKNLKRPEGVERLWRFRVGKEGSSPKIRI